MSEDKKRSFTIAVKTKIEKAGKEDLKTHLESIDTTIEKISKGLSGLSKKMTNLNTKSTKTMSAIAKTLATEAESLTSKSKSKTQNTSQVIPTNPAIDKIVEEVTKLSSYFESKKITEIETAKQKIEEKKLKDIDKQAKLASRIEAEAEKQRQREVKKFENAEKTKQRAIDKANEKSEKEAAKSERQRQLEIKRASDEAKALQKQADRELTLRKKEEARALKEQKRETEAFARELNRSLKQEKAKELAGAKLASRIEAETEKQRQREARRSENAEKAKQRAIDKANEKSEKEAAKSERQRQLEIKRASDEAKALQKQADRELTLRKKEEARALKEQKRETEAFARELNRSLKQEKAKELAGVKLASRIEAEAEKQRQREAKKAEAIALKKEQEKNKLERREAIQIAKKMREIEKEELHNKTLEQKQIAQQEAYRQRLSIIEANRVTWQERDERRKKEKADAKLAKELEKEEKLLKKEQAKKKKEDERSFNSALDSAIANVLLPEEKQKRVKPYIASANNSSVLPSLLIFDIGVRDIVRALKILEQAFARFSERNLPGLFYDIPPELVGTLERRDVAFNIPKGTSVSAVQSLQDIAMRARYGDLQSLMLAKVLDLKYGKDPNEMLIDALKRIENVNKQSTSNARIIAQSSGLQNFYTPLIQRKQIEQYSNVRSMVTKEDIEDATKTKVEYGLFWESALDLWSKFWVNVDRANRFSSKARMEYGMGSERGGYVYNVTINANTNDVASKLEAEIKKTIDYTRNSGIMVGRER